MASFYFCLVRGEYTLILICNVLFLSAQVASYYKNIHQRLFSMVNDTTDRRWLSQLRTTMESLRHVEWNDRFFREIATLYLESPEDVSALLDSIRYETGIKGNLIHRLWQTLRDPEASPDYLLSNWKALDSLASTDSTLEAAIMKELLPLGEASITCWLPSGVPVVPIIEASWVGYLRGLWAAYRFMGFRESPEGWKQKHRIIRVIGLLEYYAYAEAANRYRAWRRGYWH